MSRVLLLSSNTTIDPYPVYPTGMGIVASALVNAGHETRQFDFLVRDKSETELINMINEFRPEYIGISIRNIDSNDHCLSGADWYLQNDLNLMKVIRKTTNAPVILGGSGFSVMPEEILRYLKADYGIAGEGEKVICDLIESLNSGKTYPVLTRADAAFSSGDRTYGPLWDGMFVDYYMERSAMLSIQTKRGCPYQCAYCTYPEIEGRTVRCKASDGIADEIERLKMNYGVDTFYFTDSIFNDMKKSYLELAETLVRRNTGIKWAAFFRPDAVSREEMLLLKRSGLYAVEAGGDAASDETLEGLNKHLTFDDIYAFNTLCVQAEIPCAHYVIFGGPQETEATIKKALKNLDKLKNCVVFAFSGIRVFPGTLIQKRAIEEGILKHDTSLLEPFYYFSPHIDVALMDSMIEDGFEGRRDRIFPPSQGLEMARIMNRHGYYGLLWDRLIGFD